MRFDDAMRKVAHRAAQGADVAMGKLARGLIKHEDDLTGPLAQAIEDKVNGYKTGGVTWEYAVLTHRRSGEEGVYGADLLIHVSLDTPRYKYSKGVLVQSKRIGPGQNLSAKDFGDLKNQCKKMTGYSPSSFVFSYDSHGLRVAAATKVSGSSDRALYDQSGWTAYRFFLELFRCPIGDTRITSAAVEDLRPNFAFAIKGNGVLDADRMVEG